jgi:glycosyltransferase involved in cell wall biosynthesis
LVISLLIKKLYQPNLSVVFHEHGEILRQNRFFYRLILLATHPYIDAYIGVSKAVTHQLSKIHPQIALKSYTIYNFYPPQIKPGTKKYSSAPKFTIGFASRIISHKGWHSIAKAAAILDRKKIPIHFVIAGDGKDRQKLISTINHRHLPNIEYIGYKQNLEDFYRHIQALVIASASEASPLTFYEAQIRGIPVIASNVPALNEFITHEQNGLLFTFSNSRELAQQAERLFSDPTLYNSLSINANQIAKQYSFEKYLEHTQKLYAKLIQ